MPLSDQLRTFADNWRGKTQAYAVDDLGGAFDRFFTSYVVFNRLYAEATYRLARRGRLNLRELFPDSRAAQDYVIQFCGAETLTRTWEGNENTAAAIHEIAEHLHNERFALKLNTVRITGHQLVVQCGGEDWEAHSIVLLARSRKAGETEDPAFQLRSI